MKVYPSCLAATLLLLPGMQPMSLCVENSPERRGELGCTVVEKKMLPDGLRGPLYWHIDRYDSFKSAQAAAGTTSVAVEAAGISWLMTIEAKTLDHRGGTHVAMVGPLELPDAPKYALQVQASRFTPGMYSLAHDHSGVEAVYVIEGEACYETPTRALKLRKGETLALPGGTPMRAAVTGSSPRHVLAIIMHDASKPATTSLEQVHHERQLAACK